MLCTVTTQQKGYPFEVTLPDGIPIAGVVLADQVRSLDWQSRHAAFICTLPKSIVNEVLAKLKLLIL